MYISLYMTVTCTHKLNSILSHMAVWHTPDIDCGAKQDRVLEHSTHDMHIYISSA